MPKQCQKTFGNTLLICELGSDRIVIFRPSSGSFPSIAMCTHIFIFYSGPPLWIMERQTVELVILTTDNCTKLPKAQTQLKSSVLLTSLQNIGRAASSASVSSCKSCNGMLQMMMMNIEIAQYWHIWCVWFLSTPDGSPSIGVFVWYPDTNYHRNPATVCFWLLWALARSFWLC